VSGFSGASKTTRERRRLRGVVLQVREIDPPHPPEAEAERDDNYQSDHQEGAEGDVHFSVLDKRLEITLHVGRTRGDIGQAVLILITPHVLLET
jgi:hypothetical protein